MASKVPNLDPKPKKPTNQPQEPSGPPLTPEDEADLDLAWELLDEERRQKDAAELAPRTPAEKLITLLGGLGREFGSEPEGDELSEDEEKALAALTSGDAKEHAEQVVSNTTAPVKLLNTLERP